MAGPSQVADQAARDDAHLQSLGIKPELKRSLGFMSNFAVAFSYISVSTGTFTLIAVGLAVAGPTFFWSWPLVILGQTFVALNFAELASHFPVAGSIYQWSKRLSNKTLGWFTGWIYFWAGVLTTTAVAITVPLVLASILDFDLASPSPVPALTMSVFIALITIVSTTLINAFGVQALSIINNLGVGAEILGMVVFALILLIFYNHQPISVLTQDAPNVTSTGGFAPIFLVGMFMSLFVVYGFDTAGTFGEETLDASRQAPRGVLSAIWLSGLVGALFLLAIILSFKDVPAQILSAQQFAWGVGGANPIGDTINANMGELGKVYLVVILAAVYVCTLAIQGATTRLMFSMGRDRRLPFGGVWGHVSHSFQTPANAAVAVGVLAALPFLLTNSPGVLADRGDRDDLRQLLPVQPRRPDGPPPRLAAQGHLVQPGWLGHGHQRARPPVGRVHDHQLRALADRHVRRVRDRVLPAPRRHGGRPARPVEPDPGIDQARRRRCLPAADPGLRARPRVRAHPRDRLLPVRRAGPDRPREARGGLRRPARSPSAEPIHHRTTDGAASHRRAVVMT